MGADYTNLGMPSSALFHSSAGWSSHTYDSGEREVNWRIIAKALSDFKISFRAGNWRWLNSALVAYAR
jgi:hypothetical protein